MDDLEVPLFLENQHVGKYAILGSHEGNTKGRKHCYNIRMLPNPRYIPSVAKKTTALTAPIRIQMQICFFIENDGPTFSLDIGEGVRWKEALTHISHGLDGLICVVSCHENTKELPALGG